MIELHDQRFELVNQVHDSVLMEIEEDLLDPCIEIACKIMENVLHLEVPTPVEVKVGDNWGDMKKWILKSKIQETA